MTSYHLHPTPLPPLRNSLYHLHSSDYVPTYLSTPITQRKRGRQRRRHRRSHRGLNDTNIDSSNNRAFVPLLPPITTPSLTPQHQHHRHRQRRQRFHKVSSPALVHFLAGGLAPASVKAILQPLDTLKTRLQARSAISTKSLLVTSPTSLVSWWKGVIPSVLGTCPAAAVFMLIYETVKHYEVGRNHNRAKRRGRVPIAAGVANFMACLIRVPCEVVKQRLQVGQYDSVGQAARGILKGGPSVVYGGFGALVARDVPFAAVNFAVYEGLKGVLMKGRGGGRRDSREVDAKRKKDEGLTKAESLGVGAIAGMAGALVSNPMDVVKTRLMTQKVVATASSSAGGGGVAASVAAKRYRHVMDCFWKIAKEEGIHSFTKGIGPRLAQKGMQYAMYFAAYETLKKSLAAALKVDMSTRNFNTKTSSLAPNATKSKKRLP